MGAARVRTRTGASIVAVVREGRVHASPGPEFPLAGGDVVVLVGSPEAAAGAVDVLVNG
jgi:TrkA domain protein